MPVSTNVPHAYINLLYMLPHHIEGGPSMHMHICLTPNLDGKLNLYPLQ